MKRSASDASVGIIALLSGLLLSYSFLGVERTLILLLVCAAGPVVIRLWNRGSVLGKIVAIILVPGILMRFLLPKRLRSAVNALSRAQSES